MSEITPNAERRRDGINRVSIPTISQRRFRLCASAAVVTGILVGEVSEREF